MNHLKFLFSVIIMSMLLAFSPLTQAAFTIDRSSEAIQLRDTERVMTIHTIVLFVEQYYLDNEEYPRSKAELAKAFRDHIYGDITKLDDPLLAKRWAMRECKRGYSYEVYPDSSGFKNGAYRISVCMEGNTKLAKDDGGISPKKYERGYQIDKKHSSTKKFYLSSDSITKELEKSPKPVAPLYQTLSPEQFASLRKNSYPEWSPKAKLTVVEYSDFECFFCLRQRQDGIIAGLKKKYGNDIDFIFKPVNFARHPGSDAKGYAALCVAKIWGVKKYQEYYGNIMDQSLANDGMLPVENLPNLAQATGIDRKKFEACVEKAETVSLYQNYTKEAFSLGLSGTPTTIIINNSTREYEMVEGAYPIANFEKAIDGLLER